MIEIAVKQYFSWRSNLLNFS